MSSLILTFCLVTNAAQVQEDAVQVQEDVYLKLTTPKEHARFANNATISVKGHLRLPERKLGASSVILTVKLYRPHKGKFVIYQMATCKLKKTKKKGMYLFEAKISRRVPFPPGKYLLRVRCLDKLEKGWPVIVTGSAFVELTPPVENMAAR